MTEEEVQGWLRRPPPREGPGVAAVVRRASTRFRVAGLAALCLAALLSVVLIVQGEWTLIALSWVPLVCLYGPFWWVERAGRARVARLAREGRVTPAKVLRTRRRDAGTGNTVTVVAVGYQDASAAPWVAQVVLPGRACPLAPGDGLTAVCAPSVRRRALVFGERLPLHSASALPEALTRPARKAIRLLIGALLLGLLTFVVIWAVSP
jgi:hypothetical protein